MSISSLNKSWFEIEDKDESARVLFSTMRQWDSTSGVQQQNIRSMRLYSNRELGALNIANYITNAGTSPDSLAYSPGGQQNRVSINVIKSCIDTLCSKISKNKVKVNFLTSGGTLEQQTRGKQLNKFINGHQQETEAFEKYKLAFRDACIFGTGFVKSYRCEITNKIKKERIFPDEIMFDPADSYYGTPRCMYQRRFVSKNLLKSKFPDREQDIESVKSMELFRGDALEPQLLVCEAWRLGQGEAGRRLLCIDGVALVDEEYKFDMFPIASMRYTEPLLGVLGNGVPDELAGIQMEINRLTRHIQECQRLISLPRIYYKMTSKFNPGHFVNGIGTFIPYSDTPPVVDTPQAVGQEVYNWLWQLVQKAYETVGISQLSANSQKPTGLDSGKALRTFNDIESERFMLVGQAYEKFIIDDCERSLMLMRDSDVISATSKLDGLEKIKWKDIKIPHDDFVIQTFPVSALPNSPEAKLQTVTELKNEGYIQPEEAADLLDYPDIEANSDIRLAPQRLIKRALERALLEGKYIPPEPFLPLDMALLEAQRYFCWAQLKDFPNDRLELIQQYIEDTIQLQLQAMPNMPSPIAPAQAAMEQSLAMPTAVQGLAQNIQPT